MNVLQSKQLLSFKARPRNCHSSSLVWHEKCTWTVSCRLHGISKTRARDEARRVKAGSGDASPWWDAPADRAPFGPVPQEPPAPPEGYEDINKERMGPRGYREFEHLKKSERQRVWDGMREVARERYGKGEMPEWFNPEWLDREEAPVNTFWREYGLEAYQSEDTWLGSDGGAGDNGDGGGGWRFWREEDPYWPLRDWGDHPMRWWTFLFAAILAAGGLSGYVLSGSLESLNVGLKCGAVLAVSAMAMSDMEHRWYGEMGVKMAWATCALVAIKDACWGWRHQGGRKRGGRLSLCGWSAVLMCVFYMWTGMSGLAEYALPMNPGGAFKLSDVTLKYKVARRWGYGDMAMR